MNDYLREIVESIKAKKQAIEDAKAEKAKRIREAKEQRRQDKIARRIEQKQRMREAIANLLPEGKTPQKRNTYDKLTSEQIAEIGTRIPGSTLVRDFCVVCGEAMRVVDAGGPNTCLDCKPTGHAGTVTHANVVQDIQYHGGRFNAAEW